MLRGSARANAKVMSATMAKQSRFRLGRMTTPNAFERLGHSGKLSSKREHCDAACGVECLPESTQLHELIVDSGVLLGKRISAFVASVDIIIRYV